MNENRLLINAVNIVISIIIFIFCSYMENNELNRTFFSTVIIYCCYISLFHYLINDKPIISLLSSFLILIFYALTIGFAFFFIIAQVQNKYAHTALVLLFYVSSSLYLLYKYFNVKINLRSILIFAVITGMALFAPSFLNSIHDHYYGFPLMCMLGSLIFTTLFIESNRPSHNPG